MINDYCKFADSLFLFNLILDLIPCVTLYQSFAFQMHMIFKYEPVRLWSRKINDDNSEMFGIDMKIIQSRPRVHKQYKLAVDPILEVLYLSLISCGLNSRVNEKIKNLNSS